MKIDTRADVNIVHTIQLTQAEAKALYNALDSICDSEDNPITERDSPALFAFIRDELDDALHVASHMLHDFGMEPREGGSDE